MRGSYFLIPGRTWKENELLRLLFLTFAHLLTLSQHGCSTFVVITVIGLQEYQ